MASSRIKSLPAEQTKRQKKLIIFSNQEFREGRVRRSEDWRVKGQSAGGSRRAKFEKGRDGGGKGRGRGSVGEDKGIGRIRG